MKNLIKPTLVSGSLIFVSGLFANLFAAPLISPTENLDIFFNGSVSAVYNSNVLSSPGGPNKFDDYSLEITPGIEVQYGRNSQTTIDANYSEKFLRYLQHSSLNTELSTASVNIARDMDPLNLAAHASYTQGYNNSPSTITAAGSPSTITRYDTIDAGFDADYKISSKFNASVGFDYTNTTYEGSSAATYQGTDNYSVPASIYYVYTDKLSFGLVYNYNQSDPKSTPTNPARWRESNSISASVKFSNWEKLTGTVNGGITDNYVSPGGIPFQPAEKTLTASYGVDLQYAFTDKMGFNLHGSRNFSTGSAGQIVENTSMGLGASYQYTDKISLDANLITYTHSQYLQNIPPRTDDNYNTGVTLKWRPTSYLTLSATYAYLMNSSTMNGATYNDHTVTLTASIHY